MSNTFFCSDLHFGHSNIIKYSNRPFANVEKMNEALIHNWNAIVKPEDIVFNLGDFSFQKYPEFKNTLRRLHGKINLVLGNHDTMIVNNQKDLLNLELLNSIQHYLEFKHNGQLIVMLHYGMRVWRDSHKGSIMCYGHSHGSLPPHGKSVDVGIDCKEITDEYRPIHLDELLKYMSKREPEKVDHHRD